MANCSDAFGTITVQKVGKEFKRFLNKVQGDDTQAYYKLAEVQDFEKAEVDENGDLSFDFSTMGRWNYSSNLEGYLDGNWMNGDTEKEAYAKFIKALEKKKGVVVVEYSDSDPAMGWMSKGTAQLEVVDGSVRFVDDSQDEDLNLTKYATINGLSIYEAFDILHGEEPAEKWDAYVKECKEKGVEPKDPQVWYDEDFEWE